jgi:hypothetical protein
MLQQGYKMLKISALVVSALILAGCQTSPSGVATLTSAQADANPAQGQTIVRLENIDSNIWASRPDNNPRAVRNLFVCKPLACTKRTSIIYARRSNQNLNPDSITLQNLTNALETHDKSNGFNNVKGKITSVKGFPAIIIESDKNLGGKTYYSSSIYIYSGSLRLAMIAHSEDMPSARKYRDEFVSKLEIKSR